MDDGPIPVESSNLSDPLDKFKGGMNVQVQILTGIFSRPQSSESSLPTTLRAREVERDDQTGVNQAGWRGWEFGMFH